LQCMTPVAIPMSVGDLQFGQLPSSRPANCNGGNDRRPTLEQGTRTAAWYPPSAAIGPTAEVERPRRVRLPRFVSVIGPQVDLFYAERGAFVEAVSASLAWSDRLWDVMGAARGRRTKPLAR
jgi:hypothetical protein